MGQRVIQGTVVSDKMDKTVVVAVQRRKTHRLYHKVISLTTRFKAHDGENACRLGDVVRIIESRPLSRDKRWRVIEVLRKGDVADVAPETIGREIEESIAVRADTAETAPEAVAAAVGTPAEAAVVASVAAPAARAPRVRRTRARKTQESAGQTAEATAEAAVEQPAEAVVEQPAEARPEPPAEPAAEAPKRRSRAKKTEETEP